WRGYREYHRAGRMKELPRMVGFQAAGAAPIYENRVIAEPRTVATAIKICNPANWGPALEAMKDSHGWIDIVSDEEILRAYRMLAREEGIFMEPASAATVAGLIKCVKAGRFESGATVPPGGKSCNPANWGPALEAMQDSRGWIDSVSDEESLRADRMLAREEGIFMGPASAATVAGLIKCVKAGRSESGAMPTRARCP